MHRSLSPALALGLALATGNGYAQPGYGNPFAGQRPPEPSAEVCPSPAPSNPWPTDNTPGQASETTAPGAFPALGYDPYARRGTPITREAPPAERNPYPPAYGPGTGYPGPSSAPYSPMPGSFGSGHTFFPPLTLPFMPAW